MVDNMNIPMQQNIIPRESTQTTLPVDLPDVEFAQHGDTSAVDVYEVPEGMLAKVQHLYITQGANAGNIQLDWLHSDSGTTVNLYPATSLAANTPLNLDDRIAGLPMVGGDKVIVTGQNGTTSVLIFDSVGSGQVGA